MGMSSKQSTAGEGSFVAKGPHCGVCQHVYFRADWDRTPHCSKWDESTEIDVGDVCSAFTVRDGLDAGLPDEDVDIDWSEKLTGTDAPFYPTYRDDERYGLLCGNCKTLDVAVGTMDQFECNECENSHKPADWDAAYM